MEKNYIITCKKMLDILDGMFHNEVMNYGKYRNCSICVVLLQPDVPMVLINTASATHA
jgi:hypothetical protein